MTLPSVAAGVNILPMDKIKKNAFVIRVLQWSTFIDRTFCTENEPDRTEWIEAIQRVSQDLKKKMVESRESRPSGKKIQDAVNKATSTKVRSRGDLCCVLKHNIHRSTFSPSSHRKWKTLKC